MAMTQWRGNRRGQIEVAVNWIYILIAGAVILLFFVSIVVQQKAKAERELSRDVVQLLHSIFSGASASEKTKNSVDTAGLAEHTLYFSCEDDVGEYGIKDSDARIQDRITPVFSPREMQAARLNLWSLPYRLPYKVVDLLMITPEEARYIFVGDNPFIEEFLNETEADEKTAFRIQAQQVHNLEEIQVSESSRRQIIRVVDFLGVVEQDKEIPASLQHLADDELTALRFSASNMVDYYAKYGTQWKKRTARPLPVVSLGGERDAARYAAVFAGDDELYWCNMRKAFRRLSMLNEVYAGENIHLGEAGGKLGEMVYYYQDLHPELELTRGQCRGHIYVFEDNVVRAMLNHQNAAKTCLLRDSSCPALLNTAENVQQLNEKLRVDCLTLY